MERNHSLLSRMANERQENNWYRVLSIARIT